MRSPADVFFNDQPLRALTQPHSGPFYSSRYWRTYAIYDTLVNDSDYTMTEPSLGHRVRKLLDISSLLKGTRQSRAIHATYQQFSAATTRPILGPLGTCVLVMRRHETRVLVQPNWPGQSGRSPETHSSLRHLVA